MALHVNTSSLGQEVQVTTVLPVITPLGSDWAIFPYITGNFDCILGFLTQCYTEFRYLAPAAAVGWQKWGEVAGDIDLQGTKPFSRPYDFIQDQRQFGSLLNGLRTARADRTKIASKMKATGEHNVQHIHSIGSAREIPSSSLASDFDVTSYATYWNTSPPAACNAQGRTEIQHDQGGWYSVAGSPSAFTAKSSILEMLQFLVDFEATDGPIHRVSNHNGRRRESWVSDVSFDATSQGVVIVQYKIRHRLWTTTANDGRWYERVNYVTLTFTHVNHRSSMSGLWPTDWTNHPLIGFEVRLRIAVSVPSNEETFGPWWPPGQLPSATWTESRGDHVYDYVFANNRVVSDVGMNVTSYQNRASSDLAVKHSSALIAWRREIDADSLEYTRAVFYSSADALSTFSQVIRENHIETLSEFLGGASLLPTLAPFLRLYRDARALRLLDAGRDLIDVGTSLRLWDRYGGGSTLRSFEEFSSSFDRVRSRLAASNVWGPRTLNGKFSFSFPDNPRVLIARSKLRVRFDSSVILSLVMAGGAVGLTPTLSAGWDLIPFSFVVDWFLNVGQRLEDVETRSFMFLLPVTYATHSITIFQEIPDSTLKSIGIEPITASGTFEYPTFKYYSRLVSSMLPPIREGRYDYRGVYGPTDLTTAGSLAWQLMRRA